MKRTITLIPTLIAAALFTTAANAQTLVPKWSNTSVFGANQIYVNGGAYNPVSGNLIVCISASSPTIKVCSPADGSSSVNLSLTGVSGGTYPACGLAIAANGVIYACNYSAAGATKLYSWANESATPVNFASPTLGAGTLGKTMAVYGTGNNAVFILSSTSTGPLYVYYNGSAWVAKALTVTSGSVQGGISIISWSSTSCSFITKNSGGSGSYNTFNPSSASPIAVTQTGYTSVPMAFVGLTGTTTPIQGAGGYDPATGLFGFHARALTASPYTISNYLVATTSGTLPAPSGCSPVISRVGVNTTGVDSSNYGADFWGNKVFYTIPCADATKGFGFRAYDVSPYKVADTAPSSQTKNPGDSASFTVTSGGSGTLTYTWKRGSTVIVDDDTHTGATTATLTINPISTADAGTYTCTVTGAGGSSLAWTSSGGALYVPQDTTVSLTSSIDTTTYGDDVTFTASVSTASGTPTGTVTFSDGATAFGTANLVAGVATLTTNYLSAIGSPHAVTATYNGDNNYKPSTSASVTQTVGQKTLVPSATVASKPYDGTVAAVISGRSLVGVVNTDDVTLDGSGTTAFPSKDVGSYTLTVTGLALSGTTAGNYLLSTDTVTATAGISAKALAITGLSVTDKAYDRTTTATVTGTAGLSGVVGTEDVAPTGTPSAIFPSASVGTYSLPVSGLSLTGADAANYTLTPLVLSGTITAANLSVDGIFALDRAYDGTTTNLSLIFTNAVLLGVLSPDEVNLDTNSATAAFADKNIGTDKALQLSGLVLSGADMANYALVQPSTNASITARTLNITATAANKPYDGTTQATVTLANDKVAWDDVTVAYGSAAFADKDAGTAKTVTVSGITTNGVDVANYALTSDTVTTTADITAIALSVTGVSANNKPYDGSILATLGGTAALSAGVLAGEDVRLDGTPSALFDTKDIGLGKPVTVTGYVLAGGDSANYTLAQPVGLTANITPVPLSVVGVTASSKTYDGTTAATLSGTAALSAGVVSGEDVNLGGTPAALFNDANVGTAKPVTVTGYTLTGAAIGNYTLAQPAGLTADITPAASTTALVSSQNPSTNGDSVTFTATVNSTAGTPTGSVVFLTNGMTMATVALSSGSASVATADLPVGTITVLAQYAAQDNWQSSSATLSQEVQSAVTLSTTNTVLSIVSNGNGVFTLNCLGTPGAQYYVLAGSDLTAPLSTWTALEGSTNTAPSPSGLWSCQVSNPAPAFYRSVAINPAP